MPLLFKHGALATNAQSWVRSAIDKYPYPVLVKEWLPYEWTEKNLIEHSYHVEDEYNSEGTVEKRSQLYSSFECPGIGVLYFFYDKRDYDSVCALSDMVIDKSPFTTVIL